ncbi:PREDICTED: transmembrane protein 181 [Nicrophorus vespilloides]|uniref:Transmembrane protein 181 n=1 Tax=Nicrophorus vespilloides TaxID=110193 RepID=A0ABM1MQ09_NICVS|nr:PREDICTED: transmembrane protein 181 [Nicrophorus vespilloides]
MPKIDGINLGYSYHLPTAGWGLRIRNTLSQFSDLFSEFNKYIAPAYHHDRCERSVQMRLYSMHKREFVMVFVAFFACFGLALFIGLAGPPITLKQSIDGGGLLAKDNKTITNHATGPYTMRSPEMSTYNQQLWLIAKLNTGNKDDETFDKSFRVNVNIEGLTSEHKPVEILQDTKNRTRHLKCVKQSCQEFIVLHLAFLKYNHYMFTVHFYDLESFHQRYHIKDITFYFVTYNPAFTQIEVWFRLIFLLSSFVIFVWYTHVMKKYEVCFWSIEQSWINVLLPTLLFYNNPSFPMMLLANSWLPGVMDAFSQITFLACLLLYWLSTYHGLRQNDRKWARFYVPKLIIVGVLWFSALTLSILEKFNEQQDPTYNHTVDASYYYGLKIVFFTFCAIYITYLFLLMLRAYTELRSMPFFDMRLKFLTLLMCIVLAIILTQTVMGFGVGILEDKFVTNLDIHYSSSAQFMSFYGLINFYVYTMAYVYSPPGNSAIQDFGITKDNPAFSMINDSDEDVIYGSDEESRRPLNRPRNDDDSD